MIVQKSIICYTETRITQKIPPIFLKGRDHVTITLTVKEEGSRYPQIPPGKINNPHDKLFKETLGNVEVAKSFLQHYLPTDTLKMVNENSLYPEKDSFIDSDMKERFSDLLFSAEITERKGYIYFLFEHKSYPDKSVIFQLLTYLAEIWNTNVTKKQTDQLPVIIPLVIYHGATGWNIETRLSNMFLEQKELPPAAMKYIPDYEYLLYDLSNYTDDDIKGDARVKIMITLFRDIRKAKTAEEFLALIEKAVYYLKELEHKQTGMEYFETAMRYIFNVATDLSQDDMNQIVHGLETTYSEGSELIMTIADIWREEGREEGIKEGKEKEKRSVALKMLKRGLSLHLVAEVTQMDVAEVVKLKEDSE